MPRWQAYNVAVACPAPVGATLSLAMVKDHASNYSIPMVVTHQLVESLSTYITISKTALMRKLDSLGTRGKTISRANDSSMLRQLKLLGAIGNKAGHCHLSSCAAIKATLKSLNGEWEQVADAIGAVASLVQPTLGAHGQQANPGPSPSVEGVNLPDTNYFFPYGVPFPDQLHDVEVGGWVGGWDGYACNWSTFAFY